MAGFRVNSVDLDLSLAPGLLAGQRIGVSGTWIDPLIGGPRTLGDHRQVVCDGHRGRRRVQRRL